MKKIIIAIAIIASTLTTQAQDSLYVYRTGGAIESKAISAIDSITFSSAQDSMYIYHSGITVASYAKAYIDSISFTRKNRVQSSTTDAGVVINGVCWATRNINTYGTFATNSYDYGDFYQWNNNVGWPSTGSVTDWNGSWTGGYTKSSSTNTWTSANDPSPKGWRVPTFAEIDSLVNSTKVTAIWTTQNGVYGEKFTDKTTGNTLFLPAFGFRDNDGLLNNAGSLGYYWSSTAGSYGFVYYMDFDSSYAAWNINDYYLAGGFAVRSVAK